MARTWYRRAAELGPWNQEHSLSGGQRVRRRRRCSEPDPNSDDSSAEAELGASSPQGQTDLNPALRVIKIVSHPSNEVKSNWQKAVERPSQLFWEKKRSGPKETLDPA